MKNELVFTDFNRAIEVARALMDEDYVVMMSHEEEFIVLNYEWSEHGGDRSDVVFMRRDEFDELEDKMVDDILSDIRNDIKRGFYKDLSDI